ncbi:hypothetical protein Tco_0806048, partial [Tanacetum coccineum]
LKHVGNKKHSDLKNKTFEEIQALYEKVKRFDESFTVIGSNEDERKIKEINEGASDPDKKKKVVKEDVLTKVPAKQEVVEQGTKKRKGGHMKMLARKRNRPQSDVDSDDEYRKCLKIVTFEEPMGTSGHSTIYWRYFISLTGKIYFTCGVYILELEDGTVIHMLVERRYPLSKDLLQRMLDLGLEVAKKQYSEVIMEGIELILWGDLKIMMQSSKEENDQSDIWNNQQNWEIVTWRLYEACGVDILELKDGTFIHMLVERRYPLSKDLMQRMLDFGLEVEIESIVALDLIRFIKQQIYEE